MFRFTLKKVILFIPTWLVVSIIIFGLSKMALDDLVLNKLNNTGEQVSFSESIDDNYKQTAQELGLDKPLFYLSVTSTAYPKDLYTIVRQDERLAVSNLIKQYGNASEIYLFHQHIKQLTAFVPDSLSSIKGIIQQLLLQDKEESIVLLLNEIKAKTIHTPIYNKVYPQLENDYTQIKNTATRQKLFIPTIHWYGFDNQYHNWVSQFLRGNWGTSNNGQQVSNRINTPLSITLLLSLSTILFSYLFGVPLGIYLAQKKETKWGKRLANSVFAIYSIPTFWIAILAIRFLTTPEYGVKLFPKAGLNDLNPNDSTVQFLLGNLPHFILPILCMLIHPIMYIARITQSSIQDNLTLDYVRTARAKGLRQKVILYKHILKNASFPLITLLGQYFPLLITGSFIIEFIFNIQGMGVLTLDALGQRDWHIVYTIFMFSTLLIMIGNIVSDILYSVANPRVELR